MSTITAVHLSFVQRLEALLHDFEQFAGLAAKYAPQAGAVAVAVEAASGNPELIPLTQAAVAATTGVGTAVNAGDVLASITAVKDAVQGVKETIK